MFRSERSFLDELWRRTAQLVYKEPGRIPSLVELAETEWSPEFERLMRNRLIMGALRYGTFAEHRTAGSNGYDNVGSCIERLKKYQADGNMEHLVDVANLCLKEFLVGDHPLRHFDSADDLLHARKTK